MKPILSQPFSLTRRDWLRSSLYGGTAGILTLSPFGRALNALAAQDSSHDRRILVVLELSGGNDGLNTLVPYGDDAYYRQRPKIGIKAGELRKIDDHFGFRKSMAGFEKLYKDGDMAIVHGCGYEHPSFSHFTSMNYWHTAAPNSGREYGWVGLLADALQPDGGAGYVVNIDATQSLAVRARRHTPVVFDDPQAFTRAGFFEEQAVFQKIGVGAEPAAVADQEAANPAQRFLRQIARSAQDASLQVRNAWDAYRSPVDYGLADLDLPKVAALIEAGLPARLYYTSFRNNAFDTHVYQNNLHNRLLTYTADAVAAFMQDMERIGRADDVVMLIFSEFGRRVAENTNLGTDHGTANPMFVVGRPVSGGHYGDLPSLSELDDTENLIYTTDFRRVYASMIEGWLGHQDSTAILNGDFEPFALFT